MKIKALNEIYMPTLYISMEAIAKVRQYVDQSPKEVGWFGQLEVEKSADGISDILTLYAPYAPAQEVSAATTDIDSDAIAKYALSLDDPASIKWWGHSHVYMDTHPSGTDMKTFLEHVESDPESPFVMTIHNKDRDDYANIYLGRGLYIENAIIYIDYGHEEMVDIVAKELEENVREYVYVKPNQTNVNHPRGTISKPIVPYNGSGGRGQQSREPDKSVGNAERNAMGLR